MDGLEAVELNLNEVYFDNLSFRIDAEYFKKAYVVESKILIKNKAQKLIDLSQKIDVGFVGPMVNEYKENGIKLLQTKNVSEFFVNEFDMKFIDEKFNKLLSKSQIQKHDILIARSGSFGKASIYLSDEVINSSDIIIVEVDANKINPFYVVAFLNSNLGINQLLRFASGGLQGHVNLTILENLKVPILDVRFQNEIGRIITHGYLKIKQAEAYYVQAEKVLLDELGLDNWHPTQANTEVKSFKNSFLQSGRLDAEYYQPKYDVLTAKIQHAEHYKLSELVKIKKSIEPGSAAYLENGIPFIRVANLSKFGLTEPDIHLSITHQHDIENLFPKKETILLSKDGSVGIAYKMEEDLKAVTSGAILHLAVKSKKVIPDYLTLVLNSVLTQLQAERDAGGSIIQHWRMTEIENILIPVIEMKKQEEIAELIKQSFTLKKQSKQLLRTAKLAVEMAIEEGEEKAMELINNTLNSHLQ